jgi:hypothetical protein
MRIRLKPAITISNDDSGKYKLFAPDETSVERVMDAFTREFSGIAQVAALAMETLALGDVTLVRGLWLSASADCQISINGGALIQLRKPTASSGTGGATLVLEAEITSLQVTAGAAAVDIIYAVWGDAA